MWLRMTTSCCSWIRILATYFQRKESETLGLWDFSVVPFSHCPIFPSSRSPIVPLSQMQKDYETLGLWDYATTRPTNKYRVADTLLFPFHLSPFTFHKKRLSFHGRAFGYYAPRLFNLDAVEIFQILVSAVIERLGTCLDGILDNETCARLN